MALFVIGFWITANLLYWTRGDYARLTLNYNTLGKVYDEAKSTIVIMQMQLDGFIKKPPVSAASKHINDMVNKTTPKQPKQQTPKTAKPVPVSDPTAKRFVLLDLEATCDDRTESWVPKDESEIIEIGAIMIDEHGKRISSFHTYVKPVLHPTISAYCTNLTKITQELVDSAPVFSQAISMFKEWIAENDLTPEAYWLVSWGHYDRQQIAAECEACGQDIEWLRRHTSLKHEHARINRTRQGLGMGVALRKEGFEFVGDQHTATADTENMAKIFLKYFDRLAFASPKFIKRKDVDIVDELQRSAKK